MQRVPCSSRTAKKCSRLAFLAVAAVTLSTFGAPGKISTEFAQCKHFFPAHLPPIVAEAPLLRELCFSDFAVLHSGGTKTPVFVAQRLSRHSLQQAAALRRPKHFYAEARLPSEERAELPDYHGSGYSRGHMAPAGDMGTREGKAQTFSLANMAPQDTELNGGAWNTIEQDTRKYALRAAGTIHVFTGPVYSAPVRTMGPGNVHIPQHFYKLVYDPSTGRSWAHWQDNTPQRKVNAPISYKELVERTGIEFIPR